MGSTSVDQSTTDAIIRLAYFRAQYETKSHSCCFVAQTESTSWDRHRMNCGRLQRSGVWLGGIELFDYWPVIYRCDKLLQSLTLFDCQQEGHHQQGDQKVTTSDLMGHSCLHRLPGYFEEFAPGGCEYQQQKLKKPLMQAWTRFELPDLLITPEGWPVSTGHLWEPYYKSLW